MAKLMQAKTHDELKGLGVAALRTEYEKLATTYNRLMDGDVYYCHCCNEFKNKTAFYNSKITASGLFYICKECLLNLACDYDKKEKVYYDNKEKTEKVFEMMNLPFIEALYKNCLAKVNNNVGEKNKTTAYILMLTQIKSLPQYTDKTWRDSQFDDSDGEALLFHDTRTARPEIKKFFGSGFTETDYLFLQDQYDDFRTRTQVDSISQEIYVKQICMSLLEIDRDRKNGKDVTNKLKSLDTLMNSANLQPKQSVDNSADDTMSLGQWIEKIETTRPISEPDEEFKDVNGIGKYIRVWFSGWLSKALGFKNCYTTEFEEEVAKYTVTKPEVQEDEESDDVYNTLFGGVE